MHEQLSVGEITDLCFEPGYQMVKCDPRRGAYQFLFVVFLSDTFNFEINEGVGGVHNK